MRKKHRSRGDVYEFEKLEFSGVENFVSTRKGGFSLGSYSSLNLALHVDDEEVCVLRNRKAVARALGVELNDFVFLKQVHSGNVVVVKENDCGSGSEKYEEAIANADAMITNLPETCLIVLTADCVPVLLYDSVEGVVAAVHAGWQGTMKAITMNTVMKMQEEFGCKAENIIAGIGPSIGPCCYEVTNEDLSEKWRKMYPNNHEIFKKRGERMFLDLWKINELQLLQLGVRSRNIEIAGICTQCNVDEFYSYREEEITGRFGSGIVLRKS